MPDAMAVTRQQLREPSSAVYEVVASPAACRTRAEPARPWMLGVDVLGAVAVLGAVLACIVSAGVATMAASTAKAVQWASIAAAVQAVPTATAVQAQQAVQAVLQAVLAVQMPTAVAQGGRAAAAIVAVVVAAAKVTTTAVESPELAVCSVANK